MDRLAGHELDIPVHSPPIKLHCQDASEPVCSGQNLVRVHRTHQQFALLVLMRRR